MSFSYRLACLSHGSRSPLERTLRSFKEHVTPDPTEVVIYYDGSTPAWRLNPFWAKPFEADKVTLMAGGKQLGFCGATRKLWEEASHPGVEYVFWLEHDFEFVRDVDLRKLADVLGEYPSMAQVALMRDAVNPDEKAAGGLFEHRRGDYSASQRPHKHLMHVAYFTTNPSLMRRSFMVGNPWPSYADQCEGRFGIDLRARSFHFGVWGSGEVWVEHIGERAEGFGY